MSESIPKYIGAVGEVTDSHQFDEQRLSAYLHKTIENFQGPLTVSQFVGGQSNPTYLLSTPPAKYVLRRKPPGSLLKSAHAVDREFRVLSALVKQGFPVPEVLVLCEDESVVGTMFYVMRFVPGRIFWDCLMPDLTRSDRRAVFDSAIDTLAQLHAFDYTAIGLDGFGRPGSYFTRQIARWSRQYIDSKTEDIPEMEQVMAWLATAAPAEDGKACLIHGDFSFHNLVIHPTQPRVVAVLDWELSTIGHPMGDLMYHLMAWYRPRGVDARGTLRNHDLRILGVPSLEDSVARYCAQTGLSLDGNLAFYRVYNLFRVAAISQGIAGRLRDGTAISANAADIAARVRPLAEAAWLEIRG